MGSLVGWGGVGWGCGVCGMWPLLDIKNFILEVCVAVA